MKSLLVTLLAARWKLSSENYRSLVYEFLLAQPRFISIQKVYVKCQLCNTGISVHLNTCNCKKYSKIVFKVFTQCHHLLVYKLKFFIQLFSKCCQNVMETRCMRIFQKVFVNLFNEMYMNFRNMFMNIRAEIRLLNLLCVYF